MTYKTRFVRRGLLLLAAPLVTGAAVAATVSGISPSAARLDALQTFVVSGSGMSAGRVTIPGCSPGSTPDVVEDGGARLTFLCEPTGVGRRSVLLDGADTGLIVTFERPSRTGSPAARGVPSIGGVSLFNGNYHLQVVDMSVPTKGMPFVLSRSYNTYDWNRETARGAVSNNKPWRFNWEVRAGFVPETGSTQIFVQQADGSGHVYRRNAAGDWQPMDAGNFNRLMVGADSITVTTRAGVRQTFELPGGPLAGRLREVADVHGQAFTLNYGANGKVSRVQDPLGRNYTFSYDAGGRLVRVTDFFNRSVQYTWECGPAGFACGPAMADRERLRSAVEARFATDPATPVRTTLYSYGTFESPAGADVSNPTRILLTQVTDPGGKPVVRLTHAFAAYGNWGVASVADGVGNTWAFAYCADAAANETSPAVCGSTDAAKRLRTTVTPPLGAARLAFFDTAGRHTGSIDGRGRRSAAISQPISELDEGSYNLAGLTKAQQSPLALQGGWATEFEHDSDPARAGLPTKLRQRLGGSTIETLTEWAAASSSANLFCTQATVSPEGLRRATTRDDHCRAVAQAEPGRPASTLSYAKPGMPTKVSQMRNPLGGDTLLDYDTTGNLNRTVGPLGETTSTTYDRIGRVQRQTDELGGVTVTTYEGGSNRVRTVTDPLGRVTRFEYDNSGNLARRTAPNGQVTTYAYDNANRLVLTATTVTTASGPQVVRTQNVYDALGRVERVVNGRNNATRTTYDDAGQVSARANGLSQTTRYEYDDDGRVTKVIDPLGREVQTTYDELGRVTSVTTPAGSQSYVYDKDGRVVEYRDARNLLTRYRYHPSTGLLEEVIDARNVPTRATHDAAGNVTSITDPNGNTTSFEYDKSSRRTKRTDPNGDVWTWEYNAAGQVRFARAPGGLVVESVYDLAGQLIEQRRQPENQVVKFDHDLNGNRIRMEDATGVTTYAYDGIDRLVEVRDPRGKVLKFAYDAAGNRTAITYPHGQVVSYGYDAAERMVTVTDWLGKTHTYTLNAAGQVLQLAMGNGTRETRTYDAAGRPKTLVNSGPGGAVISSHTLQMDENGNITEAAVQLPLLPSFGASTKVMTYDAANRLTSVDGQTVTYDSAGRLTRIGVEGYGYDSRDLLTTITGPNAGTNTYNGLGHRVARSDVSGTTRYVIDPSAGDMFSLLQENDGGDNLLRSYVYGYGLLMQISAANAPRHFHFDPTGHTLALTDQNASTTDKYAYAAYGESTGSGATVNPFRFVGKLGVLDEGNGLHFMRARFFSQRSSTFLSLDALEGAISEPKSLNRYAYAFGNPVSLADPTGYSPSQALGEAALDKLRTQLGEEAFDTLAARLCPEQNAANCKNLAEMAKAASSFLETNKDSRSPSGVKSTALFDGLTILHQISSGRNVSLSSGAFECSLEDLFGNPNYGSKQDCLDSYQKTALGGSAKWIENACDQKITNDNWICFGAIYVQQLGQVFKTGVDNVVRTGKTAWNSQVLKDSRDYWTQKGSRLLNRVLE